MSKKKTADKIETASEVPAVPVATVVPAVEPKVAPVESESVEQTLAHLGIDFAKIPLFQIGNLGKGIRRELERQDNECKHQYEQLGQVLTNMGIRIEDEPETPVAAIARRPGRPRVNAAPSANGSPSANGAVTGARVSNGGKWTLPTGVLEVLRQNKDGQPNGEGVHKAEFPALFRRILSYKSSASTDDGFAVSIYTTGINKNVQKGFVEKCGGGKFRLSTKGLALASKQAK